MTDQVRHAEIFWLADPQRSRWPVSRQYSVSIDSPGVALGVWLDSSLKLHCHDAPTISAEADPGTRSYLQDLAAS